MPGKHLQHPSNAALYAAVKQHNQQYMAKQQQQAQQVPVQQVPQQQTQEKEKPSYVTINNLKIDLATYSRLNDFATISGRRVNKIINFAVKRFLSDLPAYDKSLLNAIRDRRGLQDIVVEPKNKS